MKPIVLTLMLLILLTGCQSMREPSPTLNNSTAQEDSMSFTSANWYSFSHVFTPDEWPEPLTAEVIIPNRSAQNLPIMLLVHGGGWQRRSLDDMTPIAHYWAKRGFITVNVAYRFAPRYRFPEQLYDIQLAMHWINRERSNWGSESAPIVAFGFSSGAHLVALMSNVAGQGGVLDTPHGGVKTRPDLVILGGLPSDLRKWDSGRLIEDFLGGKQEELAKTYALASPITHLHRKAPPAFLFHGKLDRLVPPDHATDYFHELEDLSIDTEIKLLPLRGHVTSFIFRRSALDAAEVFIRQRLNY